MIVPYRVPRSFQFFEIDKDKNKEIELYINKFPEVCDLHMSGSLYVTQKSGYLF